MKSVACYVYSGLIFVCLILPLNSYSTQILSVRGLVIGVDGSKVNGIEVMVANSTKGLTQVGATGESGEGIYSVVFIDFFGSVADAGDVIQATVRQNGKIIAKAVYILNADDIAASGAVIDIQLRPAPRIAGISPVSGLAAGGTIIRITGENFQEGAQVIIGDSEATEVAFVSSAELTAKTPPGAAGSVAVVVANPDGQSAIQEEGFTYTLPPPVVTAVDPTSAPTTGGIAAAIRGENFQNGATVRFGDVAAANVQYISASELTFIVPPAAGGAAGEVVITVANPDGREAKLTTPFVYTPLPVVITSITPNTDRITGGVAVTIVGENFQEGAKVAIGGNEASDVVFVSPTELTAKAPAGVAGSADVVVTNPDGQSATLKGGFTYTHLPPVVTKVDPATGFVTGGAAVTITGENFQAGATARFGVNAATAVTFVSASELTIVAPQGQPGVVSVTVTNPDGQTATLPGAFTYSLSPPTIASVTPDSDTTEGGASVTIQGENFQSGASVKFGEVEALDVVIVSAAEITATVPPGDAGAVQITVTNPDGQSAQVEFTYTEPTLLGDLNKDGRVNIFDLVIAGGQFGQVGDDLLGDVNEDGQVNIFDLVLIGGNFGRTLTTAAPPGLMTDSSASLGTSISRIIPREREKVVPVGRLSLPLPIALDYEAGRRLRRALTELENSANISPEARFLAEALRQWLIANGNIPAETRALPNYPNPFNPETWMPYQLAKATEVRVTIYNVIGQKVRELAIGFQDAGVYRSRSEAAYWDGRNDAGELVTSGVYFYTFQASSHAETRKMIVLK
jgi:hypothetical protein